ncbi:MAG: PQQ-dependent sugar dehydrogenase [Fibrobacteria bacterium]
MINLDRITGYGVRSFFGLCVSIASALAEIPTNVPLVPVFGTDAGNRFEASLCMAEVPGQKGSFVVEEQGNYGSEDAQIWLLQPSGATYVKTLFAKVAIHKGLTEMGLLGFAFHPKFATNRKFYINYNPPTAGGKEFTYIEERTADDTFKKESGGTPRKILVVDQEVPRHKGGTIMFGPDGFLYIGMGDGGDDKLSQNLQSYLGKILRIDIDGAKGDSTYAIPSDNPYAAGGGLKEIWAYGLRNPWKWSIDAPTGDLWVGDVGENQFEEINLVRKGDNLGWRVMEGDSCYVPGEPCNKTGLVRPIFTLPNGPAKSIIGGYRFRRSGSPFDGVYIFGEYATGNVWGLLEKDGKSMELKLIAKCPRSPVSFAMDSELRVYIVTLDGTIYRLDHAGLGPAGTAALPASGPAPNGPAPVFRLCSPERFRVCYEYSDPAGRLRRVVSPDGKTGPTLHGR